MTNGTKVWIVGKRIGDCARDNSPSEWEFIGVFATEDEAVAACRSFRYFVGPATVGVALPDETVPWVGGYQPTPTTAEDWASAGGS